MIDLHSHILPGLDDGARSVDEAVQLAREAASDGVTAIAATPHVRADFPTSSREMERGVEELRAVLTAEGIAVDVLPGGELDLDRLLALDEDELRAFTLGGSGRYVLVEFAYRGWPASLQPALRRLRDEGLVALIAHPERNPEVQDHPARLLPWVAAGALVQVTAASLDGTLGRASRRGAQALLELGLVHVLASDAHGPHIRLGGLAAAADSLGDTGLARHLTLDVPAAIVAGDDVPALSRSG